jgi:nucleoside-diphosphate-sugar epimerase
MGLRVWDRTEETMRISIVGLGWLGGPLADYLLLKGFEVKGSTTTADKIAKFQKKGISPYPFFLNPYPQGQGWEDLFLTDILIINIPPQTRTQVEGFHLRQIESLRSLVEKANIPQVIFISATSVYPDLNQEASESDRLTAEAQGNPTLLEAENRLWQDKSYELTVIRLGGLLGDNRIPGLYVSNKYGVVGHAPVNYIYRKDAVRLVHWVIEKGLWNDTYNGVAPFHPLRKEVYEKNAAILGFPPPASYEQPEVSPWKKISSHKLLQTGFNFLYHPLQFPYDDQ